MMISDKNRQKRRRGDTGYREVVGAAFSHDFGARRPWWHL